jgi:hypothetical protein
MQVRDTIQAVHAQIPEGVDGVGAFGKLREQGWKLALALEIARVSLVDSDVVIFIVCSLNQREVKLVHESLAFFATLLRDLPNFFDRSRVVRFDFS